MNKDRIQGPDAYQLVTFDPPSGIEQQDNKALTIWVKVRRRRQAGKAAPVPSKPADSVQWPDAVVEQEQNGGSQISSSVVLELPGGARVPIGSAKQVAFRRQE